MMQISIAPYSASKQIIVSHDGERYAFGYSVWQSLGTKSVEDVFGLTNRYIAEMLTKEEQNQMFHVISQINVDIRRYDLLGNGITVVRNHFQTLAEIMNVDRCVDWCRGKIYLDPELLVSNTSAHYDETTFLRSEMEELNGLCIAMRILTPAMGSIISLVQREVGNDLKEATAVRFMEGTDFWNHRAFQRLVTYIQFLSDKTKNATNAPMTHRIATIELPIWRLGLAVCRKLLVSELNNTPDSSPLHRHIQTTLKDRTRALGNNKLTDKGSVGGDTQEAESVADQWRKPSSLPADEIVEEECYLEDLPSVCRDMGFTEEQYEYACALADKLIANPQFSPHNVHMSIIAMIMNDIMEPRTLLECSPWPYICAIAVAATYCMYNGFTDVARVLTAIKKDTDIGEISMSASGGLAFKRIPQELIQQLSDEYQFKLTKQKTSAGIITIEKIAEIISQSQWVGLRDVENLKSSLARLIIERRWKTTE